MAVYKSLSARRAWIEILLVLVLGIPTSVALRKESVDRNLGDNSKINIGYVALRKESVDRNTRSNTQVGLRGVALRKESVDRNIALVILEVIGFSRSPQGERG